MGDIADYMIDRMIDEGATFFSRPRSWNKPPVCQRCGSKDIEFVHTGVRWRVMEKGANKPHVCVNAASPDEFPDLD